MSYDYPSSIEYPSGMDKEKEQKKDQINSSIRNYEWAADEYDRRYGKNAYFKKFPETKVILDELYEEKQEYMNETAKEILAGDEKEGQEELS